MATEAVLSWFMRGRVVNLQSAYISGISLTYTDWVAPAQSDWQKDSFECDRDAREAFPSRFRLPGKRQTFAEQCLLARGYVKR